MSEMARQLARAIAERKALLREAKVADDRHAQTVLAGEIADLRDLQRRHAQADDVCRTPYDPR
jgi:hypothetical protein